MRSAWQIHLVEDRRLAAGSISVAVAALRFVYTVTLKRPWIVDDDIPTGRQPKKLPVVPSPEEVARFLDAVKSPKHRMILTVCYATGLRISEAVSLKPAAIDSQRMAIRVEAGKGRKDRYVMLSPTLLKLLRTYWKECHPKEWLFPGDRPGQPITSPRAPWRSRVSNNRLLSMDDGKVCFRWKDYRDDTRQKTMTLPAEEFIRRFLIHVLPDRFHRIRYFGFLGNCQCAQKLQRCRELLGMAPAGPGADPPVDYRDRFEALTGQSLRVCPHCHTGTMVVIDCIARPKICHPIPDTS